MERKTDVERRIIKSLFTVPLKDIILVIVGLKEKPTAMKS